MTTQTEHPKRATWRTIVQNTIGVIVAAGVVVPAAVAVINDELGQYLPENWLAWLVGFSAVAVAVSGATARLMAIPKVDQWLKKLRLSSSPE